MFTNVAKCTGNFIKVPARPCPGLEEVRLPVIIAKKNISLLFPVKNSLPGIPEKVKGIDLLVHNSEFEVVKGLIIFNLVLKEDIHYVHKNIVKNAVFYDQFSFPVFIKKARPNMDAVYDISTNCTYTILNQCISKQIIIDIYIELIEYRNKFI